MQRRSFLKATALAPAAVAVGAVPGLGADDARPLADLADQLDATLFSSDGLPRRVAGADAIPIMMKASSAVRGH